MDECRYLGAAAAPAASLAEASADLGTDSWLPLWILGAIRLGQRLPEVNVVVLLMIAVAFVPVLLAYRLTQREG